MAMVIGYLLAIIIGTALLALPFTHRTPISLLQSTFTAISAVTLTGLSVVGTAESWTRAGQAVLLVLMQLGGLGYMTVATIVAMSLGLRVGLGAGLQLKDVVGVLHTHNLLRVIWRVTLTTLTIEGLGALLLTLRFIFHHHVAPGRAVFEGIFYAVSAFCNAGFTLAAHARQENFIPPDPWLLTILGLLVIIGGLGFGVLVELGQLPRRRRLSLHAKLVLATTLLLIALGTVLIALFEWHNPGATNQLQRWVMSAFLAVSARTAGFSPVDLATVSPPTQFLLGLLMFIGASPESTGGGVKTTTIAVIVLAIVTLLRRRSDIEVYGRRITGEMVRLALSLVSVYLLAVLLTILGICAVEITGQRLPSTAGTMARTGQLMIEVVSAFGTVGMSANVTPTLKPLSHLLLMLGMLLGRLGPLAFVYVFAQPKRPQLRRLPTESVMEG